MAGTIYSGRAVKTLRDALKIGNGGTMHSGNLNPASDGFNANQGDLYLSVSEKKLFIKDGGTDFDWTAIVTSTDQVSIDKFTLNASDITNKYVILAEAPSIPGDTKLSIIGGIEQSYGTDFIVTADNDGRRLSWDSLSLDGFLESGDKLVITYI